MMLRKRNCSYSTSILGGALLFWQQHFYFGRSTSILGAALLFWQQHFYFGSSTSILAAALLFWEQHFYFAAALLFWKCDFNDAISTQYFTLPHIGYFKSAHNSSFTIDFSALEFIFCSLIAISLIYNDVYTFTKLLLSLEVNDDD